MAKATAICTCKECGAQFEMIKRNCHNRSDADGWERWAVDHYDQCRTCYAKAQEAAEIAKGLYCTIHLDSRKALMDGGGSIAVIFAGDTKPHKEALKELGAHWTEDYPTGNIIGDLIGLTRPPKRWMLYLNANNYEAALEKLEALGCRIESMPSEQELAGYMAAYQAGAKHKADKETKQQAALEELGPCPAWPEDILAVWPKDARWNGRFYGKPGAWRIYLSGQETRLSDVQKADMEAVSTARSEWRKRKGAILQG